MIIIKLSGGLGNQMFEYALYQSLKAKGKEVKIDDTSDYRAADRRPMQLGILGAQYERAAEEEIVQYTDSSMKMTDRIRRKLTGRKTLAYREKDMEYDPEVFERDPVYLEGFFQSEKYFADVRQEVRNSFTFPDLKLTENYRNYLKMIEDANAVSIHVRRGDYLAASHNGIYEGICTVDYYERAIAYIRERCPDAVFFLFTNDVEWTKQNLSGDGRIIVEGGTEDTGYMEMYLMSRCRHHIIANSSFSWWGAWLNDSKEKIVAAPSRWLNGKECRDIYTEDMVRL